MSSIKCATCLEDYEKDSPHEHSSEETKKAMERDAMRMAEWLYDMYEEDKSNKFNKIVK